MKYYFALFLLIFAGSSNAQLGLDLTPQEVQSQPATKPNDNSSTVTCFIGNTKNSLWATGGQMITSCDPAVIEGQITEQYGMINIWQFLNDHEIKRSWIWSAKNRGNNEFQIDTYERKGKRITENVGGCMIPYEIVGETADSITIKDLPTSSGKCDAAQINAGKKLSRMPPRTYVKIKG
jgi:hypothetical protein